MALGATMARAQPGCDARTLRLSLIGIVVGALGSWAVAKAIASLLFETEPTAPATFLGMILLLGAVALVAGYMRASRINPTVALRIQ
jgi:ABC-type antimicrobial peptide transport system permease subunit